MKFILFTLPVLFILSCTNVQKGEPITDAETRSESASKAVQEEVEDGPHIEKYPSGATKIEGQYRKGLKEGTWTAYYANGLKWSEETYVNGKRSGAMKAYYPNGRMRISGQYRQDEKIGRWYFFNEEGKEEKMVDMDE